MPPQRLIVRGSSGSGKTTLAKNISEKLGVEYVEMDAIHHLPNWSERPREETCAIVDEIVQRDGWVIDGNYSHALDHHLQRADMVVWLDYPFLIVLWRILVRTVCRSIKKEELWAGNRESFAKMFSRDSIILWMVTTHKRRRKQCIEAQRALQGSDTQFVRLTSPLEAELWLANLG